MAQLARQLRDLLRVAASLRGFAADASPDYAQKLLQVAAELEARAEHLAHHGDLEPPDRERQSVLYAPVDRRI
jgi:hypothetical protein